MSRGSVTQYTTSDGSISWQFRIELDPYPDGRRRQKAKRGFATEDAAWRAARKVLRELDDGLYVDPSRQLVSAYLAEWLETSAARRKPTTNRRYRYQVIRWQKQLAGIRLGALSTLDVQRAISRLQEELTPGGVRQMHLILSIALKQAVAWQLIARSPARGVTLPAVESTHGQGGCWSPAEQARFLAKTATDPLHALWRLLLDSGMRNGEARAMTWDHLTLGERPSVRVVRTVTQDAAGHEILGEDVKTDQGRRTLSLEPETGAALDSLRRAQRQRGQGWQGSDFVFRGGAGAWLSYSTFYSALVRACQQAGVPRIPPHGLRRTMTVTWLRAGVSPRVVSDRLGHKDSAFTLAVYATVSQEWQEESVEHVRAYRRAASG